MPFRTRWTAIGVVCVVPLAHAQECSPFWSGMSYDNPHLTLISGATTDRLAFLDGPIGPTLYVGVYGAAVLDVRRWDGAAWEPMGTAGLSAAQATSLASGFIRTLDAGGGPRLYAYGQTSAARWEATHWVPIPEGFFGSRSWPLASIDLGSGARIYGWNRAAATSSIAWWDGAEWHDFGIVNNTIRQIIRYDDGTGPALYAFGEFTSIDGVPCTGFAKWDGQVWTCPSQEWYGTFGGNMRFTVYNDGTGPAIYTARGFLQNGTSCRIKKWDGQHWSCFANLDGSNIGPADVLEVFDDGRGPALYIGGQFSGVNGHPARNLIRYDGHSWEEVGGGIDLAWIAGTVQDARGRSLLIGYDGAFNVGGGRVDGAVLWTACAGPQCYANCDRSSRAPVLNVLDFMCFVNRFAERDPYANCTVDTTIDVNDFACFLNKFAAGCP